MSCEALNGGLSKDCLTNIGGITKMYIAERDSVTFPLTLSSPGNEISAFTMLGGAKFYGFYFTKGSSNYVESTKDDSTTGIGLSTQTITLGLNRREKTKRTKLELLRKKQLLVVITDGNGVNWLFGESNGVELTENNGGSGTNRTDANQYVLTMIGEEPSPANTVTDAALAAVIA